MAEGLRRLDGKLLREPSDVDLYPEPWVSGTRAATYGGPWSVDVPFDEPAGFAKALEEALDRLRLYAFQMEMNAVVGMETAVSLEPLVVHVVGTIAVLEPLW